MLCSSDQSNEDEESCEAEEGGEGETLREHGREDRGEARPHDFSESSNAKDRAGGCAGFFFLREVSQRGASQDVRGSDGGSQKREGENHVGRNRRGLPLDAQYEAHDHDKETAEETFESGVCRHGL